MVTLVTILGFINILIILHRLDLGLYFFTALIPFTSLLPATGIPGLNVTSFIIALLLIKSLSNYSIIEHKNLINVPNLNKVILFLFVWSLLSILFSKIYYTHQTLPLFEYFEKLYRWFIYILLYIVYKRELSSKNRIYYALIAIAIGVCAEGIFVAKALILSDRFRTYGTIGQPNELALFFSCYILVQLLFFIHEKRFSYKSILLGAIILSLIGITSTLSRGGLLVVFIVTTGFIVFKLKTKGIIIILIGSIFSGTLYNLLPETVTNRLDETFVDESEGGRSIGDISVERSAYSRIPLAKAGLIMFSESPIWGKGFMSYPLLVSRYEYGGQYGIDRMKASHNMHIRVLSELGLVGYFLFIRIFYNSFRTGLQLYSNKSLEKRDNDLGAILCLICAGFLIGCLFGDRFFRGTLISYFFAISAACYNILVLDNSSRKNTLTE